MALWPKFSRIDSSILDCSNYRKYLSLFDSGSIISIGVGFWFAAAFSEAFIDSFLYVVYSNKAARS